MNWPFESLGRPSRTVNLCAVCVPVDTVTLSHERKKKGPGRPKERLSLEQGDLEGSGWSSTAKIKEGGQLTST